MLIRIERLPKASCYGDRWGSIFRWVIVIDRNCKIEILRSLRQESQEMKLMALSPHLFRPLSRFIRQVSLFGRFSLRPLDESLAFDESPALDESLAFNVPLSLSVDSIERILRFLSCSGEKRTEINNFKLSCHWKFVLLTASDRLENNLLLIFLTAYQSSSSVQLVEIWKKKLNSIKCGHKSDSDDDRCESA